MQITGTWAWNCHSSGWMWIKSVWEQSAENTHTHTHTHGNRERQNSTSMFKLYNKWLHNFYSSWNIISRHEKCTHNFSPTSWREDNFWRPRNRIQNNIKRTVQKEWIKINLVRQGFAPGCCSQQCNESINSTNKAEFLDQLSNYHIHKDGLVPLHSYSSHLQKRH